MLRESEHPERFEKLVRTVLVEEVGIVMVVTGSTTPLALAAPALSSVLTKSSNACILSDISAFSARSSDTSASKFCT